MQCLPFDDSLGVVYSLPFRPRLASTTTPVKAISETGILFKYMTVAQYFMHPRHTDKQTNIVIT